VPLVPFMPEQPPAGLSRIPKLPPTRWRFPSSLTEIEQSAAGRELVAVGADLEPGTLLAAYSAGLFPMPVQPGVTGWWSPDPRAILPVTNFRASRSLYRSRRRFEVAVDCHFDAVVAACADPVRPGGWIDDGMTTAYSRLFQLGYAHSVEVLERGVLVGGLFGVSIGLLFAGESMFHRATDASKVALHWLTEWLAGHRGALLDVQWLTPHLERLGAVNVSRRHYHDLLNLALSSRGHLPWSELRGVTVWPQQPASSEADTPGGP
jgi:leucyl/phenylalanyl-tRNA--protein transferase